MSKFFGFFTSRKTRMVAVLISVFAAMIISTVFVIVQNNRSKTEYINVYEKKQQEYLRQILNQVENLKYSGKSDEEVVEYLYTKAETSGANWLFIIKGDDVIMARDVKTLSGIKPEERKREIFLRSISEADYVMVSRDEVFNGFTYTFGAVTDREYALDQGEMLVHEIYIYIAFAVIIMASIMAILWLTSRLNRVETRLHKVRKTLKEQNEKLDNLESTKNDQVEVVDEKAFKYNKTFHEVAIIETFLKKSDDVKLRPLSIITCKILMENRYYKRDEIFDAIECIRKYADKKTIIGEIRKGFFIVLLYKTDENYARHKLKTFDDELASFMQDKDMNYELKLYEDKPDMRPLERYYEIMNG
ncbi:MAG: hypothetical protein K6G63_08730 [Eubacterium sp.]|nr:hypothetical protein [Eubacterium sp.]